MNEFRQSKGGRINREKPLQFTFNGQSFTGFEGDTLASALLANGVHFVARSYKYHRPRGIMSAGNEEASALVNVTRGDGRNDANIRATNVHLFEGLNAQSQHCWPSLEWDIGEVTRLGGPVFSAGFYYKTFMWPRSFWKTLYEPIIRKSAGLGSAPTLPDPDTYTARYVHCDVLVVGAGPAGIAAALSASVEGARVILCDEKNEFGGDLLSSPKVEIAGLGAWEWLEKSIATLKERPNVTLLPRTTGFGYYEQNMLGLAERLTDHLGTYPDDMPRERLHKVRAKKVILATGAIERPLVFPGNDRPGVMLAGAAKSYLNRYGVKVGERVLVVTSHDSAYQSAFDLAEAGCILPAIIDVRTHIDPDLLERARFLDIAILPAHTIVKTSGHKRIKSVHVASIQGNVKPRILSCDALLMSGGFTPSVHLFSQSRGRLKWDEKIGAAVPDIYVQEAVSIGAANGEFLLRDALNPAGLGFNTPEIEVQGEAPNASGQNISRLPKAQKANRHGAAFVDFQHDVVAKDIGLAVQEGFHSIEHIKRYTTTGMATDQGKTSNINGVNIAADALNKPVADMGLTTFRPPYTPTTFGTLAGHSRGRFFDITRKSPTDDWAKENGAVFEPVGLWRRASYFPRAGETKHQAIARECLATRASIGISDASTLGKIEVVGPDAAEFLNRFYTNPLLKLPVGRCRYALALREDGFIYDDGVIARLSQTRFHVTTTTGGAARVFANMQDYLQTEWPELKVWLTSISEQWAVIALNGPNVRKLIAPFVGDIDLDKDSFPHMSIREGTIFDIPVRLFRVSFTGELGYELNIPAGNALDVWQRLMEAGERYNITPYGVEALHYLRAEKGYIIVGKDSDGTQTPNDMGMGWAIGKNKPDFVGKRSLVRPDMLALNRPQFVGLMTHDLQVVLEEGAQIISSAQAQSSPEIIGHITSSYFSANLGHSIAFGMVAGGLEQMGREVFVPMEDRTLKVKIVDSVFYDPEGKRLND